MKHLIISLLIICCIATPCLSFEWFYVDVWRSMAGFLPCYLYSVEDCPECGYWDFNDDGWVDMIDYALMVERE